LRRRFDRGSDRGSDHLSDRGSDPLSDRLFERAERGLTTGYRFIALDKEIPGYIARPPRSFFEWRPSASWNFSAPHPRSPLTVGGSYTYSHSLDDSSDRSDASFVNAVNIKSNWTSSNYDQRHSLSVNCIYAFPKFSGPLQRSLFDSPDDAGGTGSKPAAQSDSPTLRAILDGWEFSGITVFQSGTPFSVFNGGGNNGISVPDNAGVANESAEGSFPDVIGNPRANVAKGIASGSVGPLLHNPEAFAAPQGLTFGDAGRNFLNNPHRLNFDMNMLKHFKVTEGSSMEFRIEVFNALNHTQFRIFNPNIGNTGSNTIGCYGGFNNSAAGGLTLIPGAPVGTPPVNVDCTTGSALFHPEDSHRPRTIQLGLKYSF
jgi:hypothetical protein